MISFIPAACSYVTFRDRLLEKNR